MVTKKKLSSSYVALISCERNGRRFEPGDQVPRVAFPDDVIVHWLKKGVLAETADAPEELIEEEDD